MGTRSYATQSTAATSLSTTTETVVAVLKGVSTRGGGEKVELRSRIEATWGTGTTGAKIRIYRGADATGTLVSTAPTLTVGAGNLSGLNPVAIDNPGEVANQSYCITVQQVGATANGTMTSAELACTVGES